MKALDLSPAETGIEDVDLQDDASPNNYTNLLDLNRYTSVAILVSITTSGAATTGLAAVLYQRYDKEGNAIGDEQDIATAINTKVSNECVITLNGLDQSVIGGTISTDANYAFPLGWCKFNLKLTEDNDATSSVGSMRIVVQ